MSGFVDAILNVNAILAYAIVALLVFAEDALFVGFVLPGETAAVLGGVLASRGHVQLWLMIVVVIISAIAGDTVGYEVGKHFGPHLLRSRILDRRRRKLEEAQELLRRRGGSAVFLGRFVAFFRAVMPALAGASRMPYPRFLGYNAAGGILWGAAFVILGFLAGNSYQVVAKTVGRDLAALVGLLVIVGLVVWRVRKYVNERRKPTDEAGPEDGSA